MAYKEFFGITNVTDEDITISDREFPGVGDQVFPAGEEIMVRYGPLRRITSRYPNKLVETANIQPEEDSAKPKRKRSPNKPKPVTTQPEEDSAKPKRKRSPNKPKPVTTQPIVPEPVITPAEAEAEEEAPVTNDNPFSIDEEVD